MNIVYSDIKKNSKPNIKLTVKCVEWNVWRSLDFYKYHYMNEELAKHNKNLLFSWDDQPVAFCSINKMPIFGMTNSFFISRLVVLPDFQGLSLSTKILNFIGGVISNIDGILFIKTIHPGIGRSLENNKNWSPNSSNKKMGNRSFYIDSKGFKHTLKIRMSYNYKYTGDKIDGYDSLFDKVEDLRILKANCGYKQLELF